MSEIKHEIFSIIDEDQLKDVIFMVLANKQDLPNAMPVYEIEKAIELHKIKQKHKIFGTVATTGEGIYEAFDWLYNSYLDINYDDNKLIEPISDTVNDLKKISSAAVANNELKSWYSYFNSLTSKLYRAITFK